LECGHESGGTCRTERHVFAGDRAAVRRLGFKPATNLSDALEMASDVVGRSPSITHLHMPPLFLADVT